MESSKELYDSVHGLIALENSYWDIIDTPEYQRLRELNQLEAGFLVYPSGNHKRFEHGIGAGYLANKFAKNLNKKLPYEDKIENRLIELITIAGLCHDIGHGPFSHTFEIFLNEKYNRNVWDHERGSELILNKMINDNSRVNLDKNDLNLILAMILSKPISSSPKWIYEIIKNGVNAVDVDKFDYIKRDVKKLGIPSQGYEFSFLMRNAKILNDHICYKQKTSFQFYEFFQFRYKLYKQYYCGREIKAIDMMIKDVFMEADNYYKFAEDYLFDTEKLLNLNDSILTEIQFSKSPELEKARELSKRIFSRNLYKYAFEFTTYDSQVFEKFTNENIENTCDLKQSDFSLYNFKIDYGLKNINPVSQVIFFDKNEKTFYLDLEDVSLIIPNRITEFNSRIYCKNKENYEKVKSEFEKFIKFNGFENREKIKKE